MPPEEADPPRKFYGFKATEFERVNSLSPPGAELPAAGDPGAAREGRPDRIDVHELARIASRSDVPLGTNAVRNRDNDVHDLLRLNAACETAAGLDAVALPPKRRSRRKQDYWLLTGCGNAVLGTMAAIAGPGNPILFVYAIGGVGVFNASLTWVMWKVMDDY